MKPRLIIYLTLLFLFACNRTSENKMLKGDYYVKAIDLRLFELPDTSLIKIETYFKTVPKDSMTNAEKMEYEYLQFLLKHDFIKRPYVRLLLENGDKTMLFLDKADYDKIMNVTEEQNSGEKKVRIEAEVDKLRVNNGSIYNARKLIRVEKINGKTYYEK